MATPAAETQDSEETVASQNLEENETTVEELKSKARDIHNFPDMDTDHPLIRLICYHVDPYYLVNHFYREWEKDRKAKDSAFTKLNEKYVMLCEAYRNPDLVEVREVEPVNPWAAWNRKRFFHYYRTFLFIFAMVLVMLFPFLHSQEAIRHRYFVLTAYFSLPVVVAVFCIVSLEKSVFKRRLV